MFLYITVPGHSSWKTEAYKHRKTVLGTVVLGDLFNYQKRKKKVSPHVIFSQWWSFSGKGVSSMWSSHKGGRFQENEFPNILSSYKGGPFRETDFPVCDLLTRVILFRKNNFPRYDLLTRVVLFRKQISQYVIFSQGWSFSGKGVSQYMISPG